MCDLPHPTYQPALFEKGIGMFKKRVGSATIEINVKRSERPQSHWTDFEIPVSSEMTLIGGGGMANDNPGALLTACYPNRDRTAWRVSSRDHIHQDTHFLTGYSIGLALDNIIKGDLEQRVLVAQETSDLEPHPSAIAVAPYDYVVIGGGFKIHQTGAGNLATASFPNNLVSGKQKQKAGWEVRSKDHEIESPAFITAYAICLPGEMFFEVGHVNRMCKVERLLTVPTTSPEMAHPFAIDHVMEDGYILTGGGAIAQWETTYGAGSLLWCLAPLPQEPPSIDHPTPPGHKEGQLAFLGRSKDHGTPSPCTITTYAISTKFTVTP
jgi:hypothetical protein